MKLLPVMCPVCFQERLLEFPNGVSKGWRMWACEGCHEERVKKLHEPKPPVGGASCDESKHPSLLSVSGAAEARDLSECGGGRRVIRHNRSIS